MHGTNEHALTPAANDVAAQVKYRAVPEAFIERDRARLPRVATAFTDATRLRALMAGLEQPALRASTPRPAPDDRNTSTRRWCGASPRARKLAVWRERQARRRAA